MLYYGVMLDDGHVGVRCAHPNLRSEIGIRGYCGAEASPPLLGNGLKQLEIGWEGFRGAIRVVDSDLGVAEGGQ